MYPLKMNNFASLTDLAHSYRPPSGNLPTVKRASLTNPRSKTAASKSDKRAIPVRLEYSVGRSAVQIFRHGPNSAVYCRNRSCRYRRRAVCTPPRFPRTRNRSIRGLPRKLFQVFRPAERARNCRQIECRRGVCGCPVPRLTGRNRNNNCRRIG